jgi:ubiquinone/menaquinone biosynthesis C-methylase UbiE
MIDSILRNIDGRRVLDVATQEGHFVQLLMNYLKSYSEIVGIDINEQAIEIASKNLSQENIHFLVMNAEKLEFEGESFDTVNISASLHHLGNIHGVLGEMERVLRFGGWFIVVEMHRDGMTEAELTSVYLHQWVAEIDSELGYLHNSTLSRQEIVDHVARLGLNKVEYYDFRDQSSSPMDQTKIDELERLIDVTIQRSESTRFYTTFKEQGDELRKRLHEVGAQREPRLMIVGQK